MLNNRELAFSRSSRKALGQRCGQCRALKDSYTILAKKVQQGFLGIGGSNNKGSEVEMSQARLFKAP